MSNLSEAEVKAMLRSQVAQFASQLTGFRLFLFGSRAAGTARARSDFDVGVVGAGPLPVALFYAIEDAFDALPTLHKIDWVDFAHVSPQFRQQALQHTESIYG